MGVGVAEEPTATVVPNTRRPLRKSVRRFEERSTTTRERTRLVSTAWARTYPVTPFGLIGSWTRYQRGAQSAPRTVLSTRKKVGKPLTFRRPKRAKGFAPGRR